MIQIRPFARQCANFSKVPSDDSLVSALLKALADPSHDVRATAANSLSEMLFENSAVALAMLSALRDNTQREAVVEALGRYLKNTTVAANLRRVRTAALATVIQALSDARSVKDERARLLVYRVLGRIVAFARLSGDGNVRKAIEPALQVYLSGLDEQDPAIRAELLRSLGKITIRRADTIASLNKFLERPNLPDDERQQALGVLSALKAATDPVGGK